MDEIRETQRFSCQICLKTLKSKQSLSHHMNIHTGERPFKCDYDGCGVSYRYASQLSNHRVIHKSMTGNIMHGFDDLKIFARLMIKVFQNEHKKEFKVPVGPNGPDTILPLISGSQKYSKLPSLNF